ncbi:MAG: hypothetical protein Fur002_22780 [Anaerolineales bacterium]
MQPSFPPRFHKIASILALTLAAVFMSALYTRLVQPRKDLYNELWGPAYLLVHGQSPYNTAPLHANLPAAWLPMSIGAFFPLGWLSEESAARLWAALAAAALAALLYLLQEKKLNLFNVLALTFLVFFFPPALDHVHLGQFSLIVTLCWVLAVRYNALAVAAIALALSKPHLGILALLGFLQKEKERGGLRAVIFFLAKILAACALLCVPLFIAYPNWIPDFIAAQRQNPAWLYPSLYIVFKRLLGAWGIALWALSALALTALNARLWKKLPAQHALAWSLALAPLVTPYIGSWDFVVLLPLFIWTYIHANWQQKIFLWAAYLAAWGMMANIQMMIPSHNHYYWWVPLWYIGAAALATNWKQYETTA